MFKNEKIYNIYLFTSVDLPRIKLGFEKSRDTTLFEMSEICRYCVAGQDKVQEINTWKLGTSFKHVLEFL